MQFLIDFASENREFRNLLERAAQFKIVQGIVLDIDRFWLWAWSELKRIGDERFERSLERLFVDEFRYFDLELTRRGTGILWPEPLIQKDVEGWRPDIYRYWLARNGFRGEESPIVAKICLRPRISAEERTPTITELHGDGGRLQVIIETRPRAQLTSNPRRAYSPLLGGVSVGVGPRDFGTIGVVLKDTAGDLYCITCSHVAAHAAQLYQPARRDLSSATTIGQSILATALKSCPPGTACNPWSGAAAHEIDASLIKLSENHAKALLEVLDVGPLSGVMPRASLSTLNPIQVMGRTSGFNAMQIGGLAAWYSFNHAGNDYCFKNLFEVESCYGRPGVIKGGDSGAPVCVPGANGMTWAGMIAGCDAFKGYAMYAETVEQWLINSGYNLSVV